MNWTVAVIPRSGFDDRALPSTAPVAASSTVTDTWTPAVPFDGVTVAM